MPLTMPRAVGLAFDLFGCPSACRHCYLGNAAPPFVPESEIRGQVARFRSFARDDEDAPYFQDVAVATWFHEPDYGQNYRALHELEAELSDGGARRFELLSLWRLARDEDYAAWAKSVGTRVCQVSLYGLGEKHDWFARRRGAWDDAMVALDRLLDAGIVPRVQIFLSRKILPDIPAILKSLQEKRVEARVEALGSEFSLFVHTPEPTGDARKIEHLRPLASDVNGVVPEDLLERSRRYLGRDPLWRTEADLCAELRESDSAPPVGCRVPDPLWLYITGKLDVWSNLGTLDPWWKLGNLSRDSVASIVESYEQCRPPGMAAAFGVPARELVERTGRPDSQRIYNDTTDLAALYLARYCERA